LVARTASGKLDGSAGFYEGLQQPLGVAAGERGQSTASLAMLSHFAVLLLSHSEQRLLIGAREHSASSSDTGLNALATTNPVMPPQPLSLDEFGAPTGLSALVGDPAAGTARRRLHPLPRLAGALYVGRVIKA
jgi:hypothetical protein